MTIRVGSVSKVDMIKRRTLPLPSGLVLNLNNCYLVLALSMNMIGSCLLQYDYSFKRIMVTLFARIITFNGLLNLDCSVIHVHDIGAKRYEVTMIVPLTCGTAA